MSWKTKQLGDVAKVISGYAFMSKEFVESGIPVIKIKNIRKEKVDISDTQYLPESYLSINQKYYVTDGNILISLTGSHITLPNSVVGRVAQYKLNTTALLNQRAGKISVVDFDTLDNQYLYYYLCQDEVRTEIAMFGHGGANQCNISPSNVESIHILLPSLPTQRRIASILSAYDDLIENNLKRIKLLEEAAQNIYREWFVEMRFPGYETAEWYTDEQGRKLPVGWRYSSLQDVCELVMGQSPKSEYYNNNRDGLPFHQGVSDYGYRFVQDSTFCTMSTRLAEEGDILFSVRAPVGRLNVTLNKIIIGRGLSAIRNRSGYQSFQYYQLKSYFYQEDMIGGGAIYNSVTKKVLSEQQLLLPMEKILQIFENVAGTIDSQIKNLSIQNTTLVEARDILLPRLMNQTIEV